MAWVWSVRAHRGSARSVVDLEPPALTCLGTAILAQPGSVDSVR